MNLDRGEHGGVRFGCAASMGQVVYPSDRQLVTAIVGRTRNGLGRGNQAKKCREITGSTKLPIWSNRITRMLNHAEKDRNTATLILEAAEEQFSRFGYSKVTMEEIAEQAGLGKASLYYYHSTKDELFQAVLAKKFDEFEAPVLLMLESQAPLDEKIRRYVEERHLFFNRLLGLFISDFKAIPKNRPLLKSFFAERGARELGWLIRLFDEGKRSGAFAIHSPEKTALAFLHMMQGLRLRYLRSQETTPGPSDTREVYQEMEYITGVFLNGIRRSDDGAGQPCRPDDHRKSN